MPKINGKGQAKILSHEEAQAILESEEMSLVSQGVLAVCLFTGSRVSEATQLKRSDIQAHWIRFRAETTKTGYERVVPLANELAEKLLFCLDFKPESYLFTGRYPWKCITTRTVMNHLNAECQRLGIQGVSTHSFRRTALTRMHKAGVPLAAIQRISGHKTLSSLQRYLEVSDEDLLKAIFSIGENQCH